MKKNIKLVIFCIAILFAVGVIFVSFENSTICCPFRTNGLPKNKSGQIGRLMWDNENAGIPAWVLLQ